ncbi:prolyl oligopeptidase family serine peptidase [uncultured Kordia sp.]|uniref:prolyl oligopeptidase family serine peptidase n=1 Tax=uncultured Kordia sp. TaxID=507699 RepID=UPI00261A1F8B|nr:prolyl oligopeptidase family serine peptidase [uncultured Kordia sp.]
MKKIIIFILFLNIVSCSFQKEQNFPSPPKIEKEIATDTYFDITIEDQYRNLESSKDTIVQNWYKAQGDYAHNILSNISGVDSLAEIMQEFSKRKTYRIRRTAIVDGEQYFFLKKMPNEKKYKLYYKKGYNGVEEFIYDPESFKPETNNNYVINYIRPSWNGKYVVVALTYKGREIAEMIIIDMETKKPLEQIIDKSWAASFYGVDWLPDNTSFTYLHFPNIDKNNKRSKSNTQAVLYKIGQDPKKINPVFSPQNNPELNLDTTSYPIIDIKNSKQKYAIAFMLNVTNYFDAYYTEIENLGKENIKWKPFFTIDDKVYRTQYSIDDDIITFKSGREASNYFIGQTNFNKLNFNSTNKLVEEKQNEIIDEFKVLPEGLFYSTIKNGVQAKFYKYNSKEEEIKLPKVSGGIALRSHNKKDLFVTINGWINKSERYFYNPETKEFILTPFSPLVEYPELDNLVVKEIEVLGHDGALIPLSIIHHKDTELNGENPLFIYGYGAYGDDSNPVFSTIFLTWVKKGGILCAAHVRGGGEKGEKWHLDGKKLNKPNTWKDFISCTEYLIENKYSSKEHIAAWSGSAGGIMVGRAAIERPDLFKTIIIDAGSLNPIRDSSIGGSSNYKEFGSINDSIEYKGIIAMDSYYHLKEDTKYPATLLNAGMNDPRVAPWESGKFAARLQELNKSNTPILFNVDYNAGHGSGTTVGKVYQEWASNFAFAFWQTGHPDFKLDREAAFGNKKE